MKKFLLSIFLLSLAALLVFMPLKGATAEAQTSNAETAPLIVKYRHLTPKFSRESIARSGDATISEQLKLPDTVVLRVPKSRVSEIAGKLRKNLLVEYAEEDFIAQAFEVPDDPRFPEQWGLSRVDAAGGWDLTHGGSVDIAIVDSGINGAHPDLSSKIVASVNCTASSSCPAVSPTDSYGHGTHVAGIAGAVTNNGTGVAGTSWEGRLMSVKALDNNGSGYYSWIANGIIWAADNGAEVINLSLGGSSSSKTLQNAVDYAWGKGAVVVAAAGNSGRNSATYPAYYSNAIAVAATDVNDIKASFSSYGNWVDVAAPGVSILSTYKNDYSTLSGTSMAAPYVSGLAALLFGQNSSWTNSQVRTQIESTADAISGTGNYWAKGRINVCRAVGCAGGVSSPTATPTPTLTPTPTSSPTPTPSPVPTATSTPTPTPLSGGPTATPTPTPTSTPKPWWCKYIPSHYTCR